MRSEDGQIHVLFSAFVEQLLGIRYEGGSKEILHDKLRVAAAEEGFDSLHDYYSYLRYDQERERGIRSLIDQLVVPETYFFRELAPLEWLVREVLGPRIRAGSHPRVWSCACATGEEPLTLAMLLDEQDLLTSAEIVASDVSARNLERAQTGRFRKRSLRDTAPQRLVARYLDRGQDALTIERRLVDQIHWRRLNLLDVGTAPLLGRFDVILCRNVLIYFSDDTIQRVVLSLGNRLGPEGLLLVGVSESLFRLNVGLECEERSGVFFYRRAGS